MIFNKKGLSTVVTTLIIILLVFVAIGIIWVVIRGVVEEGSQQTEFAVKCLDVDVRVTKASCNSTGTPCTITLERRAGGEAIDGVKLVYSNDTDSSGVIDLAGNIPPLTARTNSSITVPTPALSPNKVGSTPYFNDDAGNEQLCTQTFTFRF